MYDDVKEAFDGGAQVLESELRKYAQQSSQTASGKSIGTKAMTSEPGGCHSGASRSMGHGSSDSRPTRETTNRQAIATTISGQPSTELAAPAPEERFLLLCINGNYTAELSKLEYAHGAQPAIGWGVHIVEGLNWRALWILFELVMLFSLLCVIVYARVCGDIPGAFTISTYFLTVLSLLVTLLSTVAFLSLPV